MRDDAREGNVRRDDFPAQYSPVEPSWTLFNAVQRYSVLVRDGAYPGLPATGKSRVSLDCSQRAVRKTEHQVLMSRGTGMSKRPACQSPAARPAPASPPSPVPHTPAARQDADGRAADGHEADLDACIAKMLDDAPPLSSDQRDKLALILRGQRRR